MKKARSLSAIHTDAVHAVADGNSEPDLVGIAKCGSLGKWPQNIERDIYRLLRWNFDLEIEPPD